MTKILASSTRIQFSPRTPSRQWPSISKVLKVAAIGFFSTQMGVHARNIPDPKQSMNFIGTAMEWISSSTSSCVESGCTDIISYDASTLDPLGLYALYSEECTHACSPDQGGMGIACVNTCIAVAKYSAGVVGKCYICSFSPDIYVRQVCYFSCFAGFGGWDVAKSAGWI